MSNTNLLLQSTNAKLINNYIINDDLKIIASWLYRYKDIKNTFISYKQIINRFINWCNDYKLSLKELTINDAQYYQEFLKNHVNNLSFSTINLNITIIKNLYDFLNKSNYSNNNPFSFLRKLSTLKNKYIEKFLTHKEWGYILSYIKNMSQENQKDIQIYHQVRWIFSLLYLTGCRRNEIITAKMSNFIYKHGGWWLAIVGKGNKYGEIPATNELLQELIIYRKSIGFNDYPLPTENYPLIKNIINDKGIGSSMLYKTIKQISSKVADILKHEDINASINIRKLSTHWLRHTSATHQVDAGIDIRIVKENLRHSRLETTMRYQHTEQEKRFNETNSKFKIN